MLQERLPDSFSSLLDQFEKGSPEVLLATRADLSLNGQFAAHWLIATSSHIHVACEEPRAHILLTLPLVDVESFRTHGLLGCGFLQARLGDAWVDVVRYTNGLSHRFARVAVRLEQLREEGNVTFNEEDDIDKRRCPNCNLSLSFAGDVCPRCINRGAIMTRVWELLKPYRAATALMCLLILLGVATELAPPKLQQYLVDQVLQTNGEERSVKNLVTVLLLIVGGLAMTRVLLSFVNALKGYLSSAVGTKMTSDLRAQMVERLQQLSVDFYDRQPVGVLMSRVAHDTEALYGLINQLTNGFLLQILQVVGVGIMLFTLNAKLALWTLVPMPLVIYGSWYFWRYVYPQYHRYWDSSSKQAGALAGMLSGIRVVKAFAQEQREYNRFQETSNRLRESRYGVEVASTTFSSVMGLVFSLGGLIVWFVGGRDVLGGDMTLGALMAFLAYLAMFYAPLTNLAQLTTWLTSFMTASQRVFELLDTPIQVRDSGGTMTLPSGAGHVRFEDVTFGYDRNRPILKRFNLEIQPGETIGVVGRSGSGKTTLVNLLSRFYDVDSGRVTINGCNVQDLSRETLRSHIGVVLQEPFLFRGTVWENLIYGKPNSAVEDALKASCGGNAYDFIMRLPLAYDTPLGERGAGLSGGEKQRLSIARTLLYDPSILILDEATSSVDTESEKAIQDALQVLTRGRTTIAIAHRLSTLRHSDRIIVMNQGRLEEEGSHEELMRLDGVYARLVRIQTQFMADSGVDETVLAQAVEGKVNGNNYGNTRSNAGRSESDETPWQEQETESESQEEDLPFGPRWLQPGSTTFRTGPHGSIELLIDEEIHCGITALRALPASYPDQLISLRCTDSNGQEKEVGMIRNLSEWPASVARQLETMLHARCFIQRIERIDAIDAQFGLLHFQVRTSQGPASFSMRHSHGNAQDYGKDGKLLIDVDDNRYLLADIMELSPRERALFLRHIYW